jgi:hypothetical protein
MKILRIMLGTARLATLTIWAGAVYANCGSAFCTINTDFETQGEWTEPGMRVGLRYEHVKQDQARRGTSKIDESGAEGLEHFPLSNTNDNLIATFDYSINERWGIGVTVPFVQLKHDRLSFEEHESEEPGAPKREHWDYSGLGDIRVIGRFQARMGTGAAGARFGFKLPTGATDKGNDEGERAERALQPGSGSTDLILGGFVNGVISLTQFSWFAEAQYQFPLVKKDNYEPGAEALATGGLRYSFNANIGALLQVNARFKERDKGAQADHDNSGGTFAFLSPGVAISAGKNLQFYGFVEVPVYQRVNGVQLTADPSVAVGASYRF